MRVVSRNRRGQALIESAIVVPVIMLLALGAVDFGRVFAATLTASNAAKQAAAYAAQHQGDGSTTGGTCARAWGQTADIAIQSGTSLGVGCSNVTISAGTADPYGRTPITVTVSAPFSTFTPVASGVLNLHRVGGSATARGETW